MPAGGGRRRIRTHGYAGRKVGFLGVFFLLNLRQETECLVGRDGGVGKVGKIGIEGNRERKQI